MTSNGPPTSPLGELHEALQQSLLRAFFGSVAGICLMGALAMPMMAQQLTVPTRVAMALGYGSLGVLAALAMPRGDRRGGRLLPLVVMGGVTVVAGVAMASGWGLQTPGLLFFGMATCMANALALGRLGLGTTALALAAIVVLGAAERLGMLPSPIGLPGFWPRILLHMLAIVSGTLVGRAVARLLQEHMASAEAREQRFRSLLGISTSAYWETDASLRLTHVSRRQQSGAFVPVNWVDGSPPWAVDALQADHETLTRMQADMQARKPLRELAFRWQLPGMSPMNCLSSGEPRFDTQGQFLGYWGVVHDVTAEYRAQQELRQSQALLAQVVSMSPDVIALTELPSGRYVMVNDSFTRLLGYTPAEVVGRTALELGLWRTSEERERLAVAASERGAFKELMVDMVAKDGHLVPLLITGTQLHSDGQLFALTNARDVSESTRARLEREAILANASVGIAFTRGHRLALVNAQFEKMFGWAPGTLVGQSGLVLWPSEAAHEAVRGDIAEALARGEAVDLEDTGQRRDGSTFRMRLRAKAIDPSQPATSGTIWIAEDVTEARRAEQELARARDAAESANRAKSTFLANTSHEIRTPLNGLTGLARLARQPGLPPGRLRQYLDQIGESADQLAAIISDILDVSKIEAGKLEVEIAPFDLPSLLQQLRQSYGALAESHGLAFVADIDTALPPTVLGDALRVRQILSNFLHNALKFTSQGGIRLVARALPDARIRLEVHDTGPGIDSATQSRLFKPFTQADESITRRFGGTGLGLSICRELATLMGGEVGVHSVPGLGSCFHAELPLPLATADASAPVPAPVDPASLANLRVLLVEDNAVNMMIGVALLEDWGVQVTQAVDGLQALARVAEATAADRLFDLVLMDLQMPGMSGYETTERLRQQYNATQLPVIALTAAALVSERERAAATGMTDFITKPVDPDLLQVTLLRATSQRRSAQA